MSSIWLPNGFLKTLGLEEPKSANNSTHITFSSPEKVRHSRAGLQKLGEDFCRYRRPQILMEIEKKGFKQFKLIKCRALPGAMMFEAHLEIW